MCGRPGRKWSHGRCRLRWCRRDFDGHHSQGPGSYARFRDGGRDSRGYAGGGGYTAAKHGLHALSQTLRLELNGEPVRVTEIAPGMVHTAEFSLVRFGDQERADAVYADVDRPLVAADVAEAVRWVASLPEHVNVDELVLRPVAQAAQHQLFRGPIFDR